MWLVVVPGMAGATCDAAPGLVTLVLSLPVVMTPGMFDLRWAATEPVVEYLALYLSLFGPVLAGWGVRRTFMLPLLSCLRRLR